MAEKKKKTTKKVKTIDLASLIFYSQVRVLVSVGRLLGRTA